METVFVTIEPGSLITVNDKEQESGFVDVSYRGQTVQVFMRDVEKRADRVDVRPVDWNEISGSKRCQKASLSRNYGTAIR